MLDESVSCGLGWCREHLGTAGGHLLRGLGSGPLQHKKT